MYLLEGYTLPATQKAVVLKGPRQAQVLDIPVWDLASFRSPAALPEDLVLLEIDACGICGSDPRYFAGENPWSQHTLGVFRPSPPNMVLGHEHVGRVVAVRGEHNKHLLGIRTVGVCWKGCGGCEMCRNDMPHLCPNTVHVGHAAGWGPMEYYPGAYAQYCPAWGYLCKPLPEGLSSEEASAMDILAVCMHMAKRGRIRPGSAVVILGAGPAGNGLGQIAHLLGAGQVLLTDISDTAHRIGRACGLEVLNVAGKPFVDQAPFLKEHLKGLLVSAVFDTVGIEETFHLGLNLLGPGGSMLLVAVHGGESAFSQLALGAERTLTTTCNFRMEDFWEALALLSAGKINVKPWLSSCRLTDVPSILASLAEGKHGPHFKNVVKP